MASNRKEDEIPSTYNCLQCSSKFKHRFNLTKHIKSVHTQDEFQCDQCASSFGRKDSLEKHKRRKHTIKKCEECEFATCNNNQLANHVMRAHPPDDYTEKSAFNRKLVNITFKIKEATSPMETLENYRGKVKKILKRELQDKKMLKSYITMKIRMIKPDPDNYEETDAGFNGGTRRLLGEHDIDEFYDESVNGILEDFAEFNENGCNWVCKRVLDMQVNTVGI